MRRRRLTTGDTVYVAVNRSDTAKTVTSLPSGSLTELVTDAATSGPTVSIPARKTRIFVTKQRSYTGELLDKVSGTGSQTTLKHEVDQHILSYVLAPSRSGLARCTPCAIPASPRDDRPLQTVCP